MRRHRQVSLLLFVGGAISAAGSIMGGCLQSYDPSVSSGNGNLTGGSADGGGASCPTGQVCPDPGTMQCTLDSPQCFFQCGSPLCALGPDPGGAVDGAPIPQAAAVPPIFIGSTDTQFGVTADGSTTTDPCVQIESQSITIRERSCAPCHVAAAGTSKPACVCALTDIMSDSFLTSTNSPDYTLEGGAPYPFIAPGNPLGSLVYARIAAHTMPPADPTAVISPAAAAAIVYPSASDISVLYEWIQNCLADGGAYAVNYYGGGLNGSMCFGPCGEGGASDDGGAD